MHWAVRLGRLAIHGGGDSVIQALPTFSLTNALYAQTSPKDVVILLALFAYLLAKGLAQRRLRADEVELNLTTMRIQHIDEKATDWAAIRKHLRQSGLA